MESKEEHIGLNLTVNDIMDNVYDGISVADMNGFIVLENKSHARMFGYESTVGKKVSDLIVEEDVPQVGIAMRMVTKTGEPIGGIEATSVTSDGKKFNVMVNIAALKNSKEEIIAFTAVVRNVTELKRAQEELQKTEVERTAKEIIDAMIDGVHVVDTNGNILRENNAFAEIFGYSTLVGKNIADIMTPESIVRCADAIRQTFDEGKCFNEFPFTGMTSTGRQFPGIVNVSPLRNKKAETVAVIGVARDITEVLKTRESTEKAAVAIAKAEAERIKAEELFLVNQQLKAANQQLRASEQQLMAANQQLRAKEDALQASQEKLQKKINELTRINKLMVGRELRMAELKKTISELETQLKVSGGGFKDEKNIGGSDR